MTDLIVRVRWFLGHLDTDTPTRMHRPGTWFDRDDGLGSLLGSPAIDAAFERWLYLAKSRTTEVREVVCYHVGREEGVSCSTCTAFVGGEVYETGVRRSECDVYRWPMRAAIAALHGRVVRPGRPRLSETLRAIARTSGDLAETADTLARRYPVMGDRATALAHFGLALREVEQAWREDAPPRYLPRNKVSRGLAPRLASA